MLLGIGGLQYIFDSLETYSFGDLYTRLFCNAESDSFSSKVTFAFYSDLCGVVRFLSNRTDVLDARFIFVLCSLC